MKNQIHPITNLPHRFARASALALLTTLPLSMVVSPLPVAPVFAAQAEEEDEPGFIAAKKSKVVPIALPAGTFRYTGKKEIAKYAEALAKLVGPNHGPLGEVELLIWQGGDAARKALPDLLKKAGYDYATRDALKLDGGRIIPFVSTRPEGEGDVLAMWIEQGEALMLAWAVAAPAAGGERTPAPAQRQDAPGNQPVRTLKSRLTGLALAPGAQAAGSAEQLAGVAERLSEAARKLGVGDNVDPATTEMLGWEGNGPAPRTSLYAALAKLGYERTDHETVKNDAGKFSFFTLAGPKDSLIGMWVENGTHVVLAWGRMEAKGPALPGVTPRREERPEPAVRPGVAQPEPGNVGEAISFELPAATYYVNVMKGAMPRIPQFPALAKKPGVVRGYVYDTNGKPLKGAKLGVRSTAVGGFYSGASATTDEKGYYEVSAPAGVAHFYCADYAVEHGEGLAAVSLHPADGEAGSFATPNGEVENFVLLPYGIANRAKALDDPRASGNYYGGTVVLGWTIDDDRPIFSSPSNVPNNSTIEFTLTPVGPLMDGSRGRTIVIRKTVSASSPSQLYINNIPVAPYQVSARLVGGGAMKLRETGPYGNRPFGLEPKQATGKATLMLRPGTAETGSNPAAYGSWNVIQIRLARQ